MEFGSAPPRIIGATRQIRGSRQRAMIAYVHAMNRVWRTFSAPAAQRAVTLWELLCTLAVAGVLLASAGPPFQALILDSRRTAAVNAFVTAVQLARSETSKRGIAVVLCPTRDRRECAADASAGDLEWMLIEPDTFTPQPRRVDDSQLLMVMPAFDGGSIRSNRHRYEFRPFQRRSSNGTVTFCDRRGAAAARAVVISYTGRPRATSTGAGGQPLQCPGDNP